MSSTDPTSESSYQVSESCTTTTTCPDGGTQVSVFSYETGPSDYDNFPDGGASFTNPNAPTPPPGSMCTQDTSCTPSCTDSSGGDCGTQSPGQGGCWVTGGGYIQDADGNDSFGGNAMPMKSGSVRGEWEHVDHGTGDKSHGEVQYIVCRHVNEPGPGQPSGPSHNFDINQVYFGGPARWFENGSWADGYWFDVMAEDHGEPGNSHAATNGHGSGVPDFYHFTVRKLAGANQSGPVVYDTQGDLVGGNLQIHPPNNGHPYNGGTLPSWVSLQP
jgi:hypothetical protein